MRRHLLAAATALILASTALVAPTLASAEEAPPALPDMGTYDPADYAAEAADLPEGLVVALDTDVNMTPEEFLAQGDAAVEAVGVVDALEGAGVDVLGSRLEGTELVVNVSTEEDAAVVESTGATAELGEPAVEFVPEEHTIEPAADLYDGMGWVWSPDWSAGPTQIKIWQCSIGFTGFLVATGAKQFATAGHCTDDMVGNARTLTQTAPGSGGTIGTDIGAKIAGSPMFGSGYDVGRIAVGNGHVQKAAALTWGNGAGAPLSTTPLALTGAAAPIAGAAICKSGSRTGWTCGSIFDDGIDRTVSVDGQLVNSIAASICVRPGDSGGAAIMGNKAIGITSWTGNASTCSPTGGPVGGFFPLISPGGFESVATAYSGAWEMAATVSAPAITSISSTTSGETVNDTAISGNVPNGGPGYTVSLYLDGSSTAFTTATVNPSTRAWSITLSGVAAGLHRFSIVAKYGTWSSSSATTGYIRRSMELDRIGGANRFAVGIGISQQAFPSPANAPVVYVTTGYNYPDALSAAPAAAVQGGVLLLTDPAALPADVRAEIVRLNPAKIVVVGGPASVSAAVFNDLKTIQPDTVRLGGANRFEASRHIVESAFGTSGATTAYIATGYNFPDALSASAAGGAFGIPVILVPGTAGAVDQPTLDLLTELGVTEIKIAGGPNSVSNGILNSLKVIDPTPTRLSGADRFEASKNIAVDAFGSAAVTYLATGYNFPDALAGAPLAGRDSAPLIVVPTSCVPSYTLDAISQFTSTHVTLLGGPASLTPSVQSLTKC